jgi:hypothetical protein
LALEFNDLFLLLITRFQSVAPSRAEPSATNQLRPDMRIEVDCYAGYRGEETPRCIRMSTYKIEVKKVVDRWLAPDHRYFKVIGDDGATYIVRHDTVSWQWELVFYQTAEKFVGNDSELGKS